MSKDSPSMVPDSVLEMDLMSRNRELPQNLRRLGSSDPGPKKTIPIHFRHVLMSSSGALCGEMLKGSV